MQNTGGWLGWKLCTNQPHTSNINMVKQPFAWANRAYMKNLYRDWRQTDNRLWRFNRNGKILSEYEWEQHQFREMDGLVALMLIYLFAAALWVQKDLSKVRITDKSRKGVVNIRCRWPLKKWNKQNCVSKNAQCRTRGERMNVGMYIYKVRVYSVWEKKLLSLGLLMEISDLLFLSHCATKGTRSRDRTFMEVKKI